MSKKLPLTLESDTLNAFKADFNQMLRRLLFMMEQQEAEEGTLTAKMTVTLDQDQTRDYQANGYDGTRDITKPTFKHKVGIALQFKDEKSGSLGGNYEMVWDKELNAYVMVEIDNGQTSIFDEEEKERVVTAKEAATPAEPAALPAPEPAALPEVIDADYVDVTDEAADDSKAEKIEEFKHACKYIGQDMKILSGGGDLYSVRTIKGGSIFLTSAGTVNNSTFYISPDMCAKHVGHELICLADTANGGDDILRVSVKCIECDEVVWAMDNPSLEFGYEYETPEG